MKTDNFYQTLKEMRIAQDKWFKSRDNKDRAEMIKLQKIVDNKLNKILKKPRRCPEIIIDGIKIL